jgi:HEPN/RES N-terminal domain 1/RES domain
MISSSRHVLQRKITVCDRCFGDPHIKYFIKQRVNSQVCDFCGRKGRIHPIAAPLKQVAGFILEAIDREYERAIEALGYDSAEGGYQGLHWDSHEMLTDELELELPNDDGRLLEILVDCLGDEPWCDRNPYSLREDERFISSWERFCAYIKYERRYLFLHAAKENFELYDEHLSPSKLLHFIGNAATEYGLVVTLPAGSLLRRARQYDWQKPLTTARDFGPPLSQHATRPNRMSPAGIVMFYCSDEVATAIAEIDNDPLSGIAVGTFKTTRPIAILDLTRLPSLLDFFEPQAESSTQNRYVISFLHSFVVSVSEKLKPGGREHIDYVPTQVVTEWFRSIFRYQNATLDGICYPSAQRVKGRSFVLFADQDDILLNAAELKQFTDRSLFGDWTIRNSQEKAWLRLVGKQTIREPEAPSS